MNQVSVSDFKRTGVSFDISASYTYRDKVTLSDEILRSQESSDPDVLKNNPEKKQKYYRMERLKIFGFELSDWNPIFFR